MPSLEQKFMEALRDVAKQNGVPFHMQLRPEDRLIVRSVMLENDFASGESLTIEMMLIRPNTDIDGEAIDRIRRELNA
jgi:hypothetical protein